MKLLTKTQIKIVSSLILVIILTLPPLVNLFVLPAHAGTPTPAKETINNSQAGATGVTYSTNFTATASTAIKRLTVQFCTTGSGACTTPTGMTTTTAAGEADNVSNTGGTNTFTSNGTLQRDWTGTVAQSPLTVSYSVTTITNPSTINTTYYARITTYSDAGSTTIDSVSVPFAVLDTGSIAVSASIDPNFTFTVAGVSTGGTVNSATTNVTTTANTIPFGNLSPGGSSKIAANDVTVTSNAGNGYTVTASHSATALAGFPPLVSGSNQVNTFTGSNASPATWSAPTGNANSSSGFFGYTTESTALCTGTASRFSSNKWAGSTTTGQEVVCNTGVTAQAGQTTRLGWQIQVDSAQPTGSYTGTVILVATPTY